MRAGIRKWQRRERWVAVICSGMGLLLLLSGDTQPVGGDTPKEPDAAGFGRVHWYMTDVEKKCVNKMLIVEDAP